MTEPEVLVENHREKIKTDGSISDADRDLLLDFSDELRLRAKEYSQYRHEKLLSHGKIIAQEVGGLADAIDDREVAEDIVRWIHSEYDNEETNRDYRVALRVIGKHVTDGDDVPESLEWVSTNTSSTYDPSPEPSDMLHWETEVQDMLAACHNDRDRAAVAFAFDAGVRGGEFGDIKVGDLSDHKHGLQVTVRGKQGKRTITLIPSVPYLNTWLNKHPAPDDPDAPLWSKLDEPESLSRRMRSKIFERAADRAGIEKPITITNFRKSSAAHLASKGMNQSHIEEHHGWVRGSRVASRYISVFSEEAGDELARVYGKEVEEKESDKLAPIDCPRCGEKTPREKPLCVWCGQALEPDAANKAEEISNLLDELAENRIREGDVDEGLELLDLRRDADSDPDVRAEAIQRLLGDR